MQTPKIIGPINFVRILLISTLIALFFALILKNLYNQTHQQLLIQSQSWLQGHLDMVNIESGKNDLDTLNINNKFYWPSGPFPSVILLPSASLGSIYNIPITQGMTNILLVALILFIIYKIAQSHHFTNNDSLVLTIGFCFATNYIESAINSSSWYFSQSVTTLALFSALYEYHTKNRPLIIGFALAAGIASRITAGVATLFFILTILDQHKTYSKAMLKQLTMLMLPICLILISLALFSFAKFGTFNETSYANNTLYNFDNSQADSRRSLGLFRIEHIPANLYWYFFNFPSVSFSNNNVFPTITRNIEGTSLLLVCPIFLFLLKRQSITKEEKYLLITIGVTFFVLLTYYHWGGAQLSARYTLDFTPLLFILLLKILPKPLKRIHYIVILSSAFLNFYLLSL